jgi:hypothetical protein
MTSSSTRLAFHSRISSASARHSIMPSHCWFTSFYLFIGVEMIYLTTNNVSCEDSIYKSRGRVCHSSLFYGLFENEKMNERHVTRHHNKQHCQEERRKQTRVCEFGGFYFRFYLLSLIEEYGDGLFYFNGDLSIVGLSFHCFYVSVEDATREYSRQRRLQ